MHKQSKNRGSAIMVAAICWAAFSCSIAIARQDQQQRDLNRVKAAESANSSELFAESHALIIGVSDYNNGLKPLPGVKRDVEAVSEILRQHGFTVRTVLNPTQPQFDQAMRDFISKYGQADQNRLLIYFAGHGHTLPTRSGMQGYIIPVNAPHPERDEAGFKNVAISLDEIESYARKINSKHALFVFDSCFSGALFDVRSAGSAPASIVSAAALPVRQFITSGSANQKVPDKSVFCRQFVDGLKGAADLTGDGYITGTELGMFLYDSVTNYQKGAQTPQYGKIRDPDLDKGEFVFVNPAGGGKPKTISNQDPAFSEPKSQRIEPSSQQGAPTTAVPFLASVGWTDSGLRAQRGQQVEITITYSGVHLGKFGPAVPEGVLAEDEKRPLKSCPTGATLARIGESGEPVCLRRSAKFAAQQDGTLYFGINEGNHKDNAGTVLAKVTIYP
jgi:hypothetical protein